MSHANALLTAQGRLAAGRCVVDDGWPLRRAAERFQVSVTHGQAVGRPVPREGAGRDGRPVQPPARSPRRTPTRRERRIIAPAGEPAGGARPGSDSSWACTPRRSTGCCSRYGLANR